MGHQIPCCHWFKVSSMMAMCAPIQVSQPSHSHAPSQKTPLVQPPQSPMQTKSHRNRRVDIIPHNASIDDFSQKQVTGPLNFSRVQNVVKDGHRKPSNKNLNLGRDTKKNQTNIMFSEFSTKKNRPPKRCPSLPPWLRSRAAAACRNACKTP